MVWVAVVAAIALLLAFVQDGRQQNANLASDVTPLIAKALASAGDSATSIAPCSSEHSPTPRRSPS